MFEIREDDLEGEGTRALLALHLAAMEQNSPPGHVFALDVSGLKRPDITVWSARESARVVGIGALRTLSSDGGELKSMRTHPDHLRKGVAAAILDHILGVARMRGLKRVSLETGRGPAFEPALALYRRRGFVNGEAFGDYRPSEFSQFLHLDL